MSVITKHSGPSCALRDACEINLITGNGRGEPLFLHNENSNRMQNNSRLFTALWMEITLSADFCWFECRGRKEQKCQKRKGRHNNHMKFSTAPKNVTEFNHRPFLLKLVYTWRKIRHHIAKWTRCTMPKLHLEDPDIETCGLLYWCHSILLRKSWLSYQRKTEAQCGLESLVSNFNYT
jgi:hypothetical protein